MDAFVVHEQLIADYQAFTSGFVEPRDGRTRDFIARQLVDGLQWPDPWLSLNPSFAAGGMIGELVSQGLLDSECKRIFRGKQRRTTPGRAVDVAPASARGHRGGPHGASTC